MLAAQRQPTAEVRGTTPRNANTGLSGQVQEAAVLIKYLLRNTNWLVAVVVAGANTGLCKALTAELIQMIDFVGMFAEDHLGKDFIVIVTFHRVQIGVISKIYGCLCDGAEFLCTQSICILHNFLNGSLLKRAHFAIEHFLLIFC